MKTITKSVPMWLIATVVILLLLVVCVNVIHASLGRYTSSFAEDITFAPSAAFSLWVDQEWSTSEETNQKSLFVQVCKNYDEQQSVAVGVRVYIPTVGDTPPELVLDYNGAQYSAVPKEIGLDTVAYTTYGAGWMCCFYTDNAQNNELHFELPDNAADSAVITLFLTGAETDTDGIQVVVEPVNTGNGGNRL